MFNCTFYSTPGFVNGSRPIGVWPWCCLRTWILHSCQDMKKAHTSFTSQVISYVRTSHYVSRMHILVAAGSNTFKRQKQPLISSENNPHR